MADSKSLGTLKQEILDQADMDNSDFIDSSDSATGELTLMIRASIKRLYNMIVKEFEDYFFKEYEFDTVAGTKDYDFPSDFYKFIGLDYIDSAEDIWPCKQFLFRERQKYTNRRSTDGQYSRYRLLGTQIRILPAPQSVSTYRLSYIPTPNLPSANADTFDFTQGWDEWVKWDCIIKCLSKEESDTMEAVREREKAEQEIKDCIINRDANEPQRVLNIYDNDRWGGDIDSRTPPREDWD